MPEGMKAVDAALDRVASRMTPVIRSRAIEAGWPKEVAAKLTVVRSANGMDVSVDKSVKEQAEDLEFGSPTSAPKSVLSSLHSPQMRRKVDNVAKDSMDELVERIQRVFR